MTSFPGWKKYITMTTTKSSVLPEIIQTVKVVSTKVQTIFFIELEIKTSKMSMDKKEDPEYLEELKGIDIFK